MPKSDYFFESGDPVVVGAHGDHNYFFASGEPVSDVGSSDYFFESGTGIGGYSLSVDGTEVGYYDTNEDHQDFFNVTKPNPDDNSDPDALGLKQAGITSDRLNEWVLWVFGHYSQTEGTFGVGGILWEYKGDDGEDYTITYGSFADHDGSPLAFEGSSSGDDITTSGSDRIHAGSMNVGNGDAALFKTDGAFTSNISVTGSKSIAEIVVVGPENRVQTGSTSVSVDIVGN